MTTLGILKPFTLRAFYVNLRGVCIVTPWALHLLATNLALSLLLPVSYLYPVAVYDISSWLASLVWRGVQNIFTKINRAQITVSGKPLPQNESAIVISNHVSWTDFYLIQHLAMKSNMLGRCRWFAKKQLRWVPFLGWGLWAMGMPMISRNWDKDRQELDRVFVGPKAHQWPIWLISYSEATRYTPQRYLDTVQWCQSQGKPVPKYALYPRTKGFVATIKELRISSSIRAVYDITIAYAQGNRFLEAPSIWKTLSEPKLDRDWKFHVHAERFDIEEFAAMTDAEIASWLENRWVEKSETLERFHDALVSADGWRDNM